MPCDRHAVDVDDRRRGTVGVSLGHVENWAIAIHRGLAGGHIDVCNTLIKIRKILES